MFKVDLTDILTYITFVNESTRKLQDKGGDCKNYCQHIIWFWAYYDISIEQTVAYTLVVTNTESQLSCMILLGRWAADN